MTGLLRISNELIIYQHDLVVMALKWLEDNYGAVVHERERLRYDTVFSVDGVDIPEGPLTLCMEEVVPGVLSIKINE